jgi:dihydrofolate synthase/folylpolyglutamate synthase
VAARKKPPFSTFADASAYLDAHINLERTRPSQIDPRMLRLDRMRALLAALGDPQGQIRCVHIAGSKGKGSTVEMVASCLSAAGYAVGIYTSPHLVHVRERIRVGADPISARRFAKGLGAVAEAALSIESEHDKPSYFELLTALAMHHFVEQAVDIAVIETGLGGRLDSTNVLRPAVTAITAIQLEHTELLGTTLPEIAREKAGIFKPTIPALTIRQAEEVLETLKAHASEIGAPLRVLGDDIEFTSRFEYSPDLGPHTRISLTGQHSEYEHMPVPLKGEHQAQNCGLALAILDTLVPLGFTCRERDVAIGLAETPPSGRMELAHENPRILIDGAHNPDSINALIKGIGAHYRYDSMVMIFGCAADKNIDELLKGIALGADKVIFTRSAENPRAANPEELQHRFAEISGKMTQVEPTLKQAINTAARAVGRDDLICITGSFYIAGEAKRLLEQKRAKA